MPSVGMSKPFKYDIGWRDIINKVSATVEQRYVFSQEVVWEDKTVREVAVGDKLVVHVKTDDPFVDAVTPIAGVRSYSQAQQIVTPATYDFLVSGGAVTVTLSRTSGQSLDITIVGLGPGSSTITDMSLRARPVRASNTYLIKDEDRDSQDLNGVKTPGDAEVISPWSNVNDTRALMEVILDQRFKRLPVIEFSLKNANANRMRTMLNLTLSDRIHITEEETFTDEDYFVENLAHAIAAAGKTHETVVGCEQIPTPIAGAIVFNDPTVGFDVGVFGDRSNKYDFTNNLFIVGESSLNGPQVLGL